MNLPRTLVVSTATLVAAQLAAQSQIVIPHNAADGIEQAQSTSFPYNQTGNVRYQQAYDSSEFTDQGIFSPIVILGISFRANGGDTCLGGTYPNVITTLSSIPDLDLISTDFVTNHGSDQLTVFDSATDGAVTVAPATGTSPNDFYVSYAFSMPFVYDPSTGDDLLLDVQNEGSLFTGETTRTDFCPANTVLGARTWNTTDHLALAGTNLQFNRAAVVRLDYVSAGGLHSQFTTNTNLAGVGEAVQFTDISLTDSVITAWAWDFDNDTIVDSTAQNPSHAYPAAGSYDVTLTVTDAGGSSTYTRTAAVTVDTVADPGRPELVQMQFNEPRGQIIANTASTPIAPFGTNSDPVWQADPGRPEFATPEPGIGCMGFTGVPGTNLLDAGGGVTTNDVTISFWCRNNAPPGGTDPRFFFGGLSLQPNTGRIFHNQNAAGGLYYRGGGSAGSIGSIPTAQGTNLRANSDWRHCCLVIDDAAQTGTWYIDGDINNVVPYSLLPHAIQHTTTVIGGNAGSAGTASTLFDLDDYRVYNRPLTAGEARFLFQNGERASAGQWGGNCPGAGGVVPQIEATQEPNVGNPSFSIDVSDCQPLAFSILSYSLLPVTFGGIDLAFIFPLEFTPGCVLEGGADALDAQFNLTGSLTFGFPIPNNPGISGAHVHAQCVNMDFSGTGNSAVTRVIDIHIR